MRFKFVWRDARLFVLNTDELVLMFIFTKAQRPNDLRYLDSVSSRLTCTTELTLLSRDFKWATPAARKPCESSQLILIQASDTIFWPLNSGCSRPRLATFSSVVVHKSISSRSFGAGFGNFCLLRFVFLHGRLKKYKISNLTIFFVCFVGGGIRQFLFLVESNDLSRQKHRSGKIGFDSFL